MRLATLCLLFISKAAVAQVHDLRWIESLGGDAVVDKNGQITEVSLARTWATDNDLQRIVEIKRLKRLNLSLTYVSDRGIERLQKLGQLEDLNLDTAEFITDAAVAYLRSNPRLRRLNLHGTDVTDSSLEYLAKLTDLTFLDIGDTQITDVGLEHLASLAKLEELNLGGDKISGVSLNVLKLLPNLKKLSFRGIQRRNAGLCWAPVITDQELDTISLLTGLEELNIGWGVGLAKPNPAGNSRGEAECRIIGGIRVTDLGVQKLTRLKQLRRLDLSGSSITSAGLKQLQNLPHLERLSLWNCKTVDDSAGEDLAALPSLTTLDLSNTAVGDTSLQRLAGLSHLRELYLTDTHVTSHGMEEFRAKKSGCLVSWAQRPSAPAPAKPKAASDGTGEP